MPSKVTSSQKQ